MEGYLLSFILSLRTRMEGNLCTYLYIWWLISCKIVACFNFCLLCFALLRFVEHASESLDPSTVNGPVSNLAQFRITS